MKAAPKVILSTNERERVAKLGEYFRDYLFEWMSAVFRGVSYSPGVERELCMALLETACATTLSRDELGSDEQNVEHCRRVAKDLRDLIEKELGS